MAMDQSALLELIEMMRSADEGELMREFARRGLAPQVLSRAVRPL